MAADAVKQMLIRFRTDLNTLKGNAREIRSIVQTLSNEVKSTRDRSASEAKTVHDTALKQIREQAAADAANAAKKRALLAESAQEAKNEFATKMQSLALEQKLLAVEQARLRTQQQHNQEQSKERGGGGVSLLTSFMGAAGGGGLLNTVIAGAAGGGAFMLLERLAEKAGEVVKTFSEMPLKAGELEEHLEKLSARAGVTTDQMQQLRLAGSSVGMSMEQVARIFQRMQMQFTRTGTGVSRAEKELARFGVSLREGGNLVSNTEIVKRVADLFANELPNGMTKSRLAADIFGARIGSQMIPLLNQGGEAIQELYDRADKYSIIVNEDVLKAQRQWKTETEALHMQWEQLEVTLGSGILPKLAKMVEYLNDALEGWRYLLGATAGKDFEETARTFTIAMAMREGMKTGKTQDLLQLSEKGRRRMTEEIPEQVQRFLAGGMSDAHKMDVASKGRTWQDAVSLLGNTPDAQKVMQMFYTQFPEAFEKSNKAAEGLDKRLFDLTKNEGKVQLAGIKLAETLAQLKEKTEQFDISNKQMDLKERYDSGLIAQEEYVSQSKVLDKELLDSKLAYIDKWSKFEKQKIDINLATAKEALKGEVGDVNEQNDKIALMDKEAGIKKQIVDAQTNEKRLDAHRQLIKETHNLDELARKSREKALQIDIQTELKLREDGLNQQKTLLENSFKDNLTTASNYLEQRHTLIEKEVELQIEAANNEYDATAKSAESRAKLFQKIFEAIAKGEKDSTTLLLEETKIRVDASQRQYNMLLNAAQGRLTTAKESPLGGVSANAAMVEIINISKAFRDQQALLLNDVDIYSTKWFEILGNMQKATEEIRKQQIELEKSMSILISSSALFTQLGGLLSGTRGNFGTLSQLGGIFGQLGEAAAKRKAIFNTDLTGESGITSAEGGIFGNLKDSITNLIHGDGSFEDLSKSLQGAVGAIGGFIQMLSGSRGKAGDIISGALGGGALGGQLGSLFSSFSAFAGPIGMAAGVAFGGVLSSIIGHKNNQTQDYLNEVKKQMITLQTAMQDGTVGIQQGINTLTSLRAGILSQAGSSKKKQKQQLLSEAQAIQDQITQLQQQQEAMFVDLANQLKVLNSPVAFQGLLGTLNEIMQQYKKFAGAARDANDLAKANQFLADSLRNFADTQMTDLNQAEQTAIQDAIKLNDLLLQRYQLVTNEAQTEYDIMTQGVLVNQRTQAMTKMQQIAQARYQRDQQLLVLNQEIDVTTYKVNSEMKIFNLATTRIGLEGQLTILQEALIDKDMARIKAIQQVVAMLQSGTAITNMDQVIAALFGNINTTLPAQVPSGGNDLQSLLNDLRNSRGRAGFGPFQGMLHA